MKINRDICASVKCKHLEVPDRNLDTYPCMLMIAEILETIKNAKLTEKVYDDSKKCTDVPIDCPYKTEHGVCQ